jgi:SAM-dependent methyltransferase
MDINEILRNYPKTRPLLDARVEKIYAAEYKKNRDGESAASSIAQRLESWMHNRVSQTYVSNDSSPFDTLEIGAGTLNQIPFESIYCNYDIVEPMSFLFEGSQFLSRVRNHFSDISEIPLTTKYNRIISVAVLEHVEDLPQLVEKSIKHLTKGGVFTCGIPSEGGFLWGLAWRLSTGLEFRIRTGLDYGNLMRHEHLNEAWEIEKVLQYFFKDVIIKRFGFGKHFSLYSHIECRNPITT